MVTLPKIFSTCWVRIPETRLSFFFFLLYSLPPPRTACNFDPQNMTRRQRAGCLLSVLIGWRLRLQKKGQRKSKTFFQSIHSASRDVFKSNLKVRIQAGKHRRVEWAPRDGEKHLIVQRKVKIRRDKYYFCLTASGWNNIFSPFSRRFKWDKNSDLWLINYTPTREWVIIR